MRGEHELHEAMQKVEEYFSAAAITENTVLAAYLRAANIAPQGAAWMIAKAALQSGASFEDATAAAAADRSAIHVDPASPLSPVRAAESFTEDQGRRSTAEAPAGSDSSTTADVGWEHDGSRLVDRDESSGGTFDGSRLAALAWFPKVFGPGDMDGEGAKRLLGTPNIPTVSVLVRETAQNSWDARVGHLPVDFRLHLRRASSVERDLLSTKVFTGDGTGLGLRESLLGPELWLLEVTDRGTKGLGGPTRNDLDPPPGVSTDFIDLIFNVGAPRDVRMGAGTYGFGKTIAYQVSKAGTVLFWSRSHDSAGAIEDRLIGSAIGSSFVRDGRRFTGRHWWGHTVEDRVEPEVGEAARTLGEQLFHTHFEDAQTGTSILIVDPDLGGESRADDARRLADACLWHLWPKMVDGQGRRTPMSIEVMLEGERVPIANPVTHGRLGGAADALSSVRAAQQGASHTPQFNTQVHEVWCRRPEKLLGHLALSRFPFKPEADGESDVAPFAGPSAHVSLMRHDAELVVKYDGHSRLDHPTFQWSGVFKPVPDVDDSFALSEPPAHDDWVPAAMKDPRQKKDVNVALKRIAEIIGAFLQPAQTDAEDISQTPSVAAVADSLAGLVGGLQGSAPGRREAGRASARGPAKPRATVVDSFLGELRNGRRRGYSLVRLAGPQGTTMRVAAHVEVGVEGGSERSPELAEVVGWVRDPAVGVIDKQGFVRSMREGEECWVAYEFEPSLAVDLLVDVIGDDE